MTTKLNTLIRIAAAAAIGTALGLPAAAQTGPRVVGTGENASVEYDVPSANIVGGALARIVGSGESAEMETIAVIHAMPGRINRMVGSGESAETVYEEDAAQPVVVFTGAQRRR
jgi:hypothetical protein